MDSTAGTTSDPKRSLLELHDLGPCKVVDTPGLDELTKLGAKKAEKALSIYNSEVCACLYVKCIVQGRDSLYEYGNAQADIAIICVDPFTPNSIEVAKEIQRKNHYCV